MESGLGFILDLAGGFASTIIYFALAKILKNQVVILSTLVKQEVKESKPMSEK